MLFKRALIGAFNDGGVIPERMRQGAGILANISPVVVATDANVTLTVDQMAGGLILYSSFSAGRNLTTPTAVAILAACTDMDIGDSFTFIVAVVPAFAGTWVAGAGVTLVGRATVPASGFSIVTVTKTAAATVNWTTT